MVLLTRGSGHSGADWRLQLSAHVVRSLPICGSSVATAATMSKSRAARDEEIQLR